MSGNRYYTVELSDEVFLKETEKAYCFQFADGIRANIPKSQMRDIQYEDGVYSFELPDWLVEANNLEEYVAEEPLPLFDIG